MQSTLRGRRGFTLIELLVVIAIIAILVSLLLPAVQQSREAARRSACKNNLAQMALAVHNYELAWGMIPIGVTDASGPVENVPAGHHYSWIARMLPFFEQGPLYDRLNFDISAYDSAYDEDVRMAIIETLRCPSSSAHSLVEYSAVPGALEAGPDWVPDGEMFPFQVEAAISNYAGCTGSHEVPVDETNNGLFVLNRGIRYAEITDGTSSTILIGEFDSLADARSVREGSMKYGFGWISGTRGTLRNCGTRINQMLPAFVNGLAEFDAPTDAPASGPVQPQGVWTSERAQKAMESEFEEFEAELDDSESPEMADEAPTDDALMDEDLSEDAEGTPRAPVVVDNTEAIAKEQARAVVQRSLSQVFGGFGSMHRSGAQFAFADGSVRYVSENIDPDVYHALGSRAGRELVTDF